MFMLLATFLFAYVKNLAKSANWVKITENYAHYLVALQNCTNYECRQQKLLKLLAAKPKVPL